MSRRTRCATRSKALEAARERAGGAPLLFGGDINIHGKPELPGMVRLGGNHVDHLYSEGRPARSAEVLDRGPLSDHPPVRVTLEAEAAQQRAARARRRCRASEGSPSSIAAA